MTNPTPSDFTQPFVNEYFAQECHTSAMSLLHQTHRSPQQNEQLEHCAHAAYYHDNQTGNLFNQVHGLWLLTKTYSALHHIEKSVHYAKQGREICGEEILEQPAAFAYSYEALGTAFAAENQPDDAHAYFQLAIDVANEISDPSVKQRFFEEAALNG